MSLQKYTVFPMHLVSIFSVMIDACVFSYCEKTRMPLLQKDKLYPEITTSNTFSFEFKDIVDQEFVKNFRFTLNSI